MSEQKTYIATRFLRHDGGKYASGELIELTDHFAKPLLAIGAVVLAPKDEATESTKPQTDVKGDDLTVAQIKEKLTTLNIDFDGVSKKADLLALLPQE